MIERDTSAIDKTGYYLGYFLSYSIFTTVLFFILRTLKKIPADWTIVHVGIITILLHVIGQFIKKALK